MLPQTPENRPKVGLAVFAFRNGKVLLGRRLSNNTWCLPGGHMEFGETFEQTARRESLEEAGITLQNIRFLHTTNDVFASEGKHYVTIFVVAETSSDPEEREPEKHVDWNWFDWESLPEPLFSPIVNLMNDGIRPDLV